VCECTEEDWGCDYGYERDKNNKCISTLKKFSTNPNADINEVPSDCNQYYYVS